MAGYEQTIILGNVGRDCELRYTQSGTAVADFSVAVSQSWTDSNGERREKTNWYKVSAWRGLAETCGKYVKKGMQVMVVGTVTASAYIGQDGEARASLELTAQTVQFVGSRGEQQAVRDGDGYNGADLADIPF